ncbi:cellulose synthase-like protein G3 [Ricinus communis]|uniref:cellulose synthase-like protein G3 n=1 Tax=Ricinus communis TaxID=3988 RepID=UPI00201AE67F|nr:cellulose synthase-like protein G3 [Ricinus communis]
MEGLTGGAATESTPRAPPLHTAQRLHIVPFNRIFALVYMFAILALCYHHAQTLYNSTTPFSFFITLALFSSDLVLAFMWSSAQASRLNPIKREEFPENLDKVIKTSDYPALDVFICTADPAKEPPMSVVNTALSVMAYDYPVEKLSVYVSDDGGSALTLFAFMEGAKFASYWLPFCRENNVMERSPEAYFESNYLLSSSSSHEIEKIKMMYESMKMRVENAVERGNVDDEYITSDDEREALNQWTHKFTRHTHPTIIKVLLENSKNKDINGHFMPNLIYVSREKNKNSHHHFKAGALNALIRVSAVMTNAPIILTLDCDMCSNDPRTPLRALCYYCDPDMRTKYAFIQFPQHFQGTNKNDIYASQFKRLFLIQAMGFDGIKGPNYVGTGCFFSRGAFSGGPSSLILPENPEGSPEHVADHKSIQSQEVLSLAYHVAGCNYENQTAWGYKMGFRYGSLVEDLFTGYRLHCEGWRSIFCNPSRPAFLGNAPISLTDLLNQQKRWAVGVLEVGFSKYSPLIYGIRHLSPLMTLTYSQYAFWSIWSVPIVIYAFLPQLALLSKVSIFPKFSEPWFLLYGFLFLGAYGQDLLDFCLAGEGTIQMWWNDQRVWTIRGVTCLLFGSIEFFLKCLGISAQGFNVTSKVVDDEQSKRYDQGIFDFGVSSPMFVTLSMAALINLVSFIWGIARLAKGHNFEGLLIQMFIAGYGVVNCWPVYEAMFLRKDKGKMPAKITVTAAFLTWALYIIASFIFK